MGQHVNTYGKCPGEGNPDCECGRYGEHRCERAEAWQAALDLLPDLYLDMAGTPDHPRPEAES